MTKILMSTSTQCGRFEFWYIGEGRWQDEIEFEDVEIIDLLIRRQLMKAVKRKQKMRRIMELTKIFTERQFDLMTCG